MFLSAGRRDAMFKIPFNLYLRRGEIIQVEIEPMELFERSRGAGPVAEES